jgi:hypothetical protein
VAIDLRANLPNPALLGQIAQQRIPSPRPRDRGVPTSRRRLENQERLTEIDWQPESVVIGLKSTA